MSAQDFTVNNSILPVEVIRVYCIEFSKKNFVEAFGRKRGFDTKNIQKIFRDGFV